ncbi:MAG: MerR family transcriptional regulator [Acidobacteria bacterium]|nr:MerR family transcriptional regulator [Acidobacteriota bacterium]
MKLKSKLYYKIGEVCQLTDIQPHVLRYWETEFPFLSPSKNSAGQRVYSRQEIQLIRVIKKLLYEEGYTIAGARDRIEQLLRKRREDEPLKDETQKLLVLSPMESLNIRRQLEEILDILEGWDL